MYGHNYDPHTHPWRKEYQADTWAALVLADLGIPSDHFECVLERINPDASETHPAGGSRAQRIRVVFWRRLGYEIAA